MTDNGWTNRETWLVNLHFEPTSDIAFIKKMLEEEAEKFSLFWQDFIDLGLVNWSELAENLDTNEENPAP